jgi:hypothetical protein
METEQKPMAELVALLPKPDVFVKSTSGEVVWGHLDEAVEAVMPKLREATSNCPACIFAAIRQAGIQPCMTMFNFEHESQLWLNALNEEQREQTYYGV